MTSIVPPSFLFEFRLSAPRIAEPSSKRKGRLLNLPDEAQLFLPVAMNEQPVFASVKAGWTESGLGVSVSVAGNSEPSGTSQRIEQSDSTMLWIDTRPTGTVHRATEYCHHFACLPVDDNNDGDPSVIPQPIAQQRSPRTTADAEKLRPRLHQMDDGYELEIWIPGSHLHGWRDVGELGRIGFYCVVQDTKLGEQPLSVGDDFPTSYDPSTWLQLELVQQ